MIRDIADILTELSSARKTGILSISIKGDPSLFKIFFREGLVYHITHGTCKNLECLARLPSLELDSAFFMSGAHVHASEPDLPGIREIIERLKPMGKNVRWEEAAQKQPGDRIEVKKPPTKVQRPDEPIEQSVVVLMEEELLNAVGPVSTMLLEDAYRACGLSRGTRLNYGQFAKLIDTIATRLPEEIKNDFVARFRQ